MARGPGCRAAGRRGSTWPPTCFGPTGAGACLAGAYRFSVKQADKFHQTGRPRALMEVLVRVCPTGGLVLDPFAGSGTTLVAALNTGRRGLGIEIDRVRRDRGASSERGRYFLSGFTGASATSRWVCRCVRRGR